VKTTQNFRLVEISSTGCRVEGLIEDIEPGQLITIRPDGLGEFAAAVIWVKDGVAGLEFDFPLRQEIVDCLSRIYPHEAHTEDPSLLI
jgi:hypothetical protein